MFLKSQTKIDRKRLSKSCYSTKFQARFVRGEKSLVTHFCNRKEDPPIFCHLKEGASILEQASRSYGGLKLGVSVP